MFCDILQKFVAKSPATVMVRGLLERLLNPETLDRWFDATAQAQYTRDILFSSLVGLMLQIVCRTQASVHAAYRHAEIATSIVSVYAKLRGVELATSQGLVRHIGREAQTLIETMNGGRHAQLPGYRLKYLDGNCLAASEHRLKPLRTTAAGGPAREIPGGLRSADGLGCGCLSGPNLASISTTGSWANTKGLVSAGQANLMTSALPSNQGIGVGCSASRESTS